MDGGGSRPFMRRESNKRSFSTMAASHRDDSPNSFSDLRDEHYDNEQAARRRRLSHQLRIPRIHFPGDGFDFRRPVMSTPAETQETSSNERSNPVVIDLTDEDATQESRDSEQSNALPSESTRATAGSSRVQRLPRWGRALVDSPSSDDEDYADTSQLPGARYLALPGVRHRPQFSSLRRPAPVPSPPPDMEDDIEVLTSQAVPRRGLRVASRVSTPAVPPPPPTHLPRNLTPYPNSLNEPVDLTQDDDDEVIFLDARQREVVNRETPIATANVGTRSLTDRGLGQLGNIANILREEGVNLGGRLMQRLQGFAGLDQELRAHDQAFEQYQHNHGGHAHRHAHHHHHHHHHRRQTPVAVAALGNLAALRMRNDNRQVGIPMMMNYGMTAFDLGIEGGGNRPPTPKYSPPPEPAPGFTRSPAEDEVVVCPNCGDELAMGDSDVKQEVWAVKTCGHVYCGECAQNRSRKSGKRGKGKAPAMDDAGLPAPFNRCVVDGCGASASSKSMVLVYLGS